MRRVRSWCLGQIFCQNRLQVLVDIAECYQGLVDLHSAPTSRPQPPSWRVGAPSARAISSTKSASTGLQDGHPGAVVSAKLPALPRWRHAGACATAGPAPGPAGALTCSSSTPTPRPQAPHQVAAAAGSPQQAGKQLQGAVSGLVAVGVVDLLEVVQVQHPSAVAGNWWRAACASEAAALGGEASPVEHAGEAIGHRQRAQACVLPPFAMPPAGRRYPAPGSHWWPQQLPS